MDQGELRRLESKCTQENPPACTAGCPIHVDARKLMLAMQSQDWKSAAGILQQKQPFPGIISRICDHPCEDVCKRKDAGASVSISNLERFCLENHPPKIKVGPVTPKSQTVAVAGSGLRGLTAAYDLARKGYSVTLFEKSDRLGGNLRNYPEQQLPAQVIENELSVLNRPNVTIECNTEITQQDLSRLKERFDALYIGVAAQSEDALELLGENSRVDPISCTTLIAGVFAGGQLGNDSPINAVADGRRGAVSIDRYLQGASLTASRDREGAFESNLFVNLNGIPSLPTVPMSHEAVGYTGEEAVQEAGRCLNCQCLECVKACKYLEFYGGYPKKYLREIYNNESIVMGKRHANKLINSCMQCGLCAEVCPNDLDMGQICLASRESMVRRGKMPTSAHDFALRDMAFSNSGQFALTRHQPGFNSSNYVFFPGCQLSGSSPEHVEKVYTYLTEQLAGGVGLMLRCCGAPAHWSGDLGQFQTSFEEMVAEWESLGKPQLIVACSTCHSMFREKLPGVVSLWELMKDMDLPIQRADANSAKVAVQDPCTTRYEQGIQAAVRHILLRLGYEIEELPYSKELTKCCGFGGLTVFANPGLAQQIVENRIKESTTDYVAYCAMCRDRFAAHGKRTLHLLDLIFADDLQKAATRPDSGFSQRHEQRARLKRKLLRKFWQTPQEKERGYRTIKIICNEQIRNIMEERLILIEDVQQVIEHAERTGRKFINPDNGNYLAYFRPARVTYWVEYQPQEDGFVVLNAYSHRMEIVEEVKP
ncbi:MAG: amine oxidase [Peptococcaceae bacterium BRH_c23]|nr:pyridine nucleotide-disulfide oxidoreductase/dicluster-binding protein [Desulfosporosinus sp. BICA1-9]KJS46827.1 MAG: amine oxidase [Peptococcaceae bacterium BRH_c23]KJS80537.1 MAG: amine oxidase [Desulfosporosinus sp. BICA1-9]HBW35938.1 FAD-binding protein [Desulfosporosinus sp.]